MWFSKVILWAVILNLVNCHNILLFFPFPGKSHGILGQGYVSHLAKAGHNITYVTPMPIKNPPQNVRIVDISSIQENEPLDHLFSIENLMKNENPFLDFSFALSMMIEQSFNAVTHENVRKILMDPSEKFDVAIMEWLFTDLYAGLSAVFDCPFIWSSSMEPHAQVLYLIGGVPNPAYVSDINSNVLPPLSFTQRAKELYEYLYKYYMKWTFHDLYVKAYEDAFRPVLLKRGRELPPFDDVLYNASLMLGNSHVSQGLSFPLPHNYKEIAGYHIEEEVIPLPKNLQDILDNAKNGVIYFSLGSMMQGKTMPDVLKQGLLKTFSKFKQTVVWKLEIMLPDLPSNVHIVHWAPQQSILAHPNTILFITHGGLLSQLETLKFGVPVIGIPLFGDQFINVERMIAKGVGIKVDLGYDMPEKLEAAVREILDNPSYRNAVEELSMVFNKRPFTPGQELVYWVEHVVETKGAKYMRSVGLMTPWYQAVFLDLIVVLILSIVLAYCLAKYLIRKMISMLRRSEKKKIS